MNQAVRFGLYRCGSFVFDSRGKPHQTAGLWLDLGVYSINSRFQCFDSRHAISLFSRGLGSWLWLTFPSELTLWGDTLQFCIIYNQSWYMCCFQLWTSITFRVFTWTNCIVLHFPLKFIVVCYIYEKNPNPEWPPCETCQVAYSVNTFCETKKKSSDFSWDCTCKQIHSWVYT